jgi:hypothetical protein
VSTARFGEEATITDKRKPDRKQKKKKTKVDCKLRKSTTTHSTGQRRCGFYQDQEADFQDTENGTSTFQGQEHAEANVVGDGRQS